MIRCAIVCTVEVLETKPLTIQDVSQIAVGEPIITTTSAITVEVAQLRAALADVKISNLKVDRTGILPYATEVNFTFDVSNIGTAAAMNVNLYMYIDGEEYFSTTLGQINVGNGYTLTWPISHLSGAHKVQFTVDCNGQTESSTANNSVSSTYTWQNAIDLAVYSIDSADGEPIISCKHNDTDRGYPDEKREIIIEIANFGNTTTTNVCLQTIGDLQDYGLVQLPSSITFPGNRIVTLTFQFGGMRKATNSYVFKQIIDPTNKIGDADRSNNTGSRNFKVTYDTEYFGGYFENANNLVAIIGQSCMKQLTADGKVTKSQVNSALKSWNGISSNVSVVETAEDISDLGSGSDIFVTVNGLLDDRLAGYTTLTTESGVVPDSESYDDPGPYIHARVELHTNLMSKSASERLTTITHEMGHALGMSHTFCDEISVMKKSLADPLSRSTPQAHDKLNLKDIYN